MAVFALSLLGALCAIRCAAAGRQPTGDSFTALGKVLRDPRGVFNILSTTTFIAGVYVVYTYLAALLGEMTQLG